MSHIGVIPARAGSVRFPGKNRALLGGVELWRRAVDKSLKTMDRTIINTDDDKIMAEFAGINSRCEIYLRPKHLRDGQSYRIDDVIMEMAKTLDFKYGDIIHLFQCTMPFVSVYTIELSKDILDCEKCSYKYIESVQSIHEVPNLLHAYSQRVLKDGWVGFAFPEERKAHYNSQLKPRHVAFGGHIACKVSSLWVHQNIWGANSLGIIVDETEAIDIDTEEDLKVAESLITAGLAV